MLGIDSERLRDECASSDALFAISDLAELSHQFDCAHRLFGSLTTFHSLM